MVNSSEHLLKKSLQKNKLETKQLRTGKQPNQENLLDKRCTTL